jgi:hypothetical protein
LGEHLSGTRPETLPKIRAIFSEGEVQQQALWLKSPHGLTKLPLQAGSIADAQYDKLRSVQKVTDDSLPLIAEIQARRAWVPDCLTGKTDGDHRSHMGEETLQPLLVSCHSDCSSRIA